MKVIEKVIERLIVGCVVACYLTSKLHAQPIPPLPTNSYLGGTNYYSPPGGSFPIPDYGTNLWIQLTNLSPYEADFYLHNTTNALFYEIFAKTNLTDPEWIPIAGPSYGAIGTNQTYFPSISTYYYWWDNGNTYWTYRNSMFFMAYAGMVWVEIYPYGPITVTQPASTNDLTQNVTNYAVEEVGNVTPLNVTCQIYGSAVYGVDYVITGASYSNATVTTTIPSNGTHYSAPFIICPLYKTNAVFGNVSLTLALTLGGQYVIDDSVYSRTITIAPSVIPVTVVTNLPSSYQAGIDYQPIQNALVISVNSPGGEPNNFILIGTNSAGALTITNWSNVAGAPNEVEIATVKTTTNGFTQGETYFGDGAVIDKLTPDGSQWTTDWCSLTNATKTDGSGICGLYLESVGTFGGDLIAATAGGGVWLIQSDRNGNAHPTLLASISTTQLGGAISLTNDVTKWGPWAGKVITGDPYEEHIYAVDTNGAVTTNDTSFAGGIAIESFALIPANQDLYFIDAANSELMKISRTALAPYVGDLVISQTATSQYPDQPIYYPRATIFIVAWDSTNSVFETHTIPASTASSVYEDVTFAPIDLPSQ